MPITITRLSEEEIKAEFKRVGNSDENLAEYIELVGSLGPGDGFTVPVTRVTRDEEVHEVVVLSEDDDMDMPTIRSFKRRLNAAAGNQNLEVKYRPKGHREGEGENAHYVTEKIIVVISATKPKTSRAKNGTAEASK
jgi:hypothetical protein